MSPVTDMDEQLDQMLEERAIGHLDFHIECDLRVAVGEVGKWTPERGEICGEEAVAYVTCRLCPAPEVPTCETHLQKVLTSPMVHCFVCGRDLPMNQIVSVTRIGGVS